MACPAKKKRKNRGLCLGDLNKKIFLKTQAISLATADESFGSDIDPWVPVWASVETTRGDQIFDGTNLINSVTHKFSIRYRQGLTQEHLVQFEGIIYRIVDVEDFEEKHDWMVLSCVKRGDKDVEVNHA